MGRSVKKHFIGKSGRWMKKYWSKVYRTYVSRILKRDLDDININPPNAVINCYDITDQIYFCTGNGNPENCWCGTFKETDYCKLKHK